MTDKQIIRNAAARIADPAHWCQSAPRCNALGLPTTEPVAEQVCGSEAITEQKMPQRQRERILDAVARRRPFGMDPEAYITNINDRQGHKAVLALLEAAMKRSPRVVR